MSKLLCAFLSLALLVVGVAASSFIKREYSPYGYGGGYYPYGGYGGYGGGYGGYGGGYGGYGGGYGGYGGIGGIGYRK